MATRGAVLFARRSGLVVWWIGSIPTRPTGLLLGSKPWEFGAAELHAVVRVVVATCGAVVFVRRSGLVVWWIGSIPTRPAGLLLGSSPACRQDRAPRCRHLG